MPISKTLSLETNKYLIKLDNFEGPLDLLCHLIEVNKMDIYSINLSEITDQYIEYINKLKENNLEIASEFLVMASTLLYIKSKGLLPKDKDNEEKELTQEELIQRIIEYKRYKEITSKLRNMFSENSKRLYRYPENIELPKQELEEENLNKKTIYDTYKGLIIRNSKKINKKAKDIEKISITDNYTVQSKVKEIFKELLKKPRFTFNKKYSIKKCDKEEVVTAFSGLLELERRNKVIASQEKTFGDIVVEKPNKKAN